MALDLEDIKRLKLTSLTLRWLKAESEKTGFSPQEIAREKLHRLAVIDIHASRLLCDATEGEDISRDSRGRKYDKDDDT